MTRVPAPLSILLLLTLGGCAASAPTAPGARSTPRTPVAPAPASPAIAAWEPIGRSVGGRPIEAITMEGGGPRVLVVGGIHGDEPEGAQTIAAAAAHLAGRRPPLSIRIVRDANPDGAAAGTRGNARGIDLNRNWPSRNFTPAPDRGPQPLSEPETRALHREIERFAPDLVLVCHSSPRGPFVNFDGPGAEYAVAFAAAAARTDPRWRVVPDMGYPTPGSLGSFVGVDRGVPILTVEFARGAPEARAWPALRDGLDAVLERCSSLPAK